MTKTKVTLSIDKQVVSQAKVALAKKGENMSEEVERFLEALSGSGDMDKMLGVLGIQRRRVGSEEIEKSRPKGLDAAEAVREMRNARKESISGH